MATRFASQFARSAAPNLMFQFSEPIGYYNAAGDAVRTIDALIERNVEMIDETGGTVAANAMIIRVRDSATLGISSTEIDTGGDEVSVALRVGEDAQRRAIVKVLSTENGLVRFGVQ